jgi:hypothetical protein
MPLTNTLKPSGEAIALIGNSPQYRSRPNRISHRQKLALVSVGHAPTCTRKGSSSQSCTLNSLIAWIRLARMFTTPQKIAWIKESHAIHRSQGRARTTHHRRTAASRRWGHRERPSRPFPSMSVDVQRRTATAHTQPPPLAQGNAGRHPPHSTRSGTSSQQARTLATGQQRQPCSNKAGPSAAGGTEQGG